VVEAIEIAVFPAGQYQLTGINLKRETVVIQHAHVEVKVSGFAFLTSAPELAFLDVVVLPFAFQYHRYHVGNAGKICRNAIGSGCVKARMRFWKQVRYFWCAL
jgi:hypothetical protein